MPRILGLGDNTVDTYVSAGLQFPGGNAVNVAVLCRRRLAAAAYLGCLGNDEAGDILFAALRAEGIDLSHVRRIDGPNARAMIAHENGDRRFVGSTKGVRGRYDLTDADFAFIATHDLVHSSINSDLEAELARVSAAARRLSYDFSQKWTHEILARTLPLLDTAFLSAPDLDDASCAALLEWCATQGCGTVVATRGSRGATARIDGATHSRGSDQAAIVDTLGAGDGFIAGFLLARLDGGDIDEALAAGSAYAAEVCGYRGAFGHAHPWTGASATAASSQQGQGPTA